MRKLFAVTAAVFTVVALAACSSSGSGAARPSSSAAGGSASTSSDTNGGGICDGGYTKGKGGVVNIFCDGSGTADAEVGTNSTTLSGGTCVESGGYFTINFGIVVGSDFAGSTKPDYIGALVPDGGGSAQAVTVRINGKGGIVTSPAVTVSSDKKTVKIDGNTSDGPATVDITC